MQLPPLPSTAMPRDTRLRLCICLNSRPSDPPDPSAYISGLLAHPAHPKRLRRGPRGGSGQESRQPSRSPQQAEVRAVAVALQGKLPEAPLDKSGRRSLQGIAHHVLPPFFPTSLPLSRESSQESPHLLRSTCVRQLWQAMPLIMPKYTCLGIETGSAVKP